MNTTSRPPVRSIVASATLLAALMGASIPAASAATASTPASSCLRMGASPERLATQKHTLTLAQQILSGRAATGAKQPLLVSPADPNDENLQRLSLLHAQKAKPAGTVTKAAAGVQYARIADSEWLVIANPTNCLVEHRNPVTKGTHVLLPQSGLVTWIPQGTIGTKWTALGGHEKIGLPTGAERASRAGVHRTATAYKVRQFESNAGSLSEIYASSKGTHQVRGAIRTAYMGNAGPRMLGVPAGGQIKKADGSISQKFERATITVKAGKVTIK